MLPMDYPNRDSLLRNIKEGFHLVNKPLDPEGHVETDNYKSATNPAVRPFVDKQLREEIDNDYYKVVSYKPQIISAIGAIPKNQEKTKFRIITDASMPSGRSMNDFAEIDPFKYQSVQDALRIIKPGDYLAKVDLSNAFRSVGIHPSNFKATGIKWKFSGEDKFTYLVDQRLCFGGKRAPGIFDSLSHAVRAIMYSRGVHSLVYYLDDWLIISNNFEQCRLIMLDLIHVLRKLGFHINYNKVEGPSQTLTFLGIQMDTVSMTLALPEKKLRDLEETLLVVAGHSKITKRRPQSLIGKLNWATQVIYGGRFYLRRLLDKVVGLKKPFHRTRVTRDMQADIQWWLQYLSVYNNSMPMVESRPCLSISTDACNVAGGCYFNGAWVYTPWKEAWPSAVGLHINHLECLAIETAVATWAPLFANHRVFVHCDNTCAVATLNKGMSRNPIVMASLRRIFWLSAVYNFRLRAVYYPGSYNKIADRISRLHEPNGYSKLLSANYAPYL